MCSMEGGGEYVREMLVHKPCLVGTVRGKTQMLKSNIL